MQNEPLEGVHVKLTIVYKGGHRSRFTVIPIQDNEQAFNITVNKFKKDIWQDYITNNTIRSN